LAQLYASPDLQSPTKRYLLSQLVSTLNLTSQIEHARWLVCVICVLGDVNSGGEECRAALRRIQKSRALQFAGYVSQEKQLFEDKRPGYRC
jgi:hypothetical protein